MRCLARFARLGCLGRVAVLVGITGLGLVPRLARLAVTWLFVRLRRRIGILFSGLRVLLFLLLLLLQKGFDQGLIFFCRRIRSPVQALLIGLDRRFQFAGIGQGIAGVKQCRWCRQAQKCVGRKLKLTALILRLGPQGRVLSKLQCQLRILPHQGLIGLLIAVMQ